MSYNETPWVSMPRKTLKNPNQLQQNQNQWHQLKNQLEQAAETKNGSENNNSAPTNSNSNAKNNNQYIESKRTKVTENLELSTLPVDMWQKEPLHREMLCWSQCNKQANFLEEQTGKTDWTSETGRKEQYNSFFPGCSPICRLRMSRLHFGTVRDRLKNTWTIHPPITGCVWQQPLETSVERSS